jgi:hypothetical protein
VVQRANWLPAPSGPIHIVLRMYWRKESVLNGDWQPPGIQQGERVCRDAERPHP